MALGGALLRCSLMVHGMWSIRAESLVIRRVQSLFVRLAGRLVGVVGDLKDLLAVAVVQVCCRSDGGGGRVGVMPGGSGIDFKG